MLSGRVGESKGDTMYHWVEDRDFLKRAYGVCADLVNQLVQNLKNYGIEARMNVVGSKKRNMSTQNAKEPIDFDFNLLIVNSADYSNGRVLKEDVRKAFNEVLSNNGWGDCDDSTSALTTECPGHGHQGAGRGEIGFQVIGNQQGGCFFLVTFRANGSGV